MPGFGRGKNGFRIQNYGNAITNSHIHNTEKKRKTKKGKKPKKMLQRRRRRNDCVDVSIITSAHDAAATTHIGARHTHTHVTGTVYTVAPARRRASPTEPIRRILQRQPAAAERRSARRRIHAPRRRHHA